MQGANRVPRAPASAAEFPKTNHAKGGIKTRKGFGSRSGLRGTIAIAPRRLAPINRALAVRMEKPSVPRARRRTKPKG